MHEDNDRVIIYGDMSVGGALTITQNDGPEFPEHPLPGTLIIKDFSLYAYIKTGTVTSWYPFANKTSFDIHTQSTASTVWTVNHDLKTSDLWLQVKDSLDNVVTDYTINNVDNNTYTLTFPTAIAGTVLSVATDTIEVFGVDATYGRFGSADQVYIDDAGVSINGSQAARTADLDPIAFSGSFTDLKDKPTSLSGYGIADAQPLDGDLLAIAALSTNGLARKTGPDTWIIDQNNYLTSNQTITLSGDATGSGATAITVNLSPTGITAGTYRSVTVDSKGRVLSGTNPTTIAEYGITDSITNTVNSRSGDVVLDKTDVGLPNVEDKSSATIRSEITSGNVTTALGYTPENSANKNLANGYAGLDSLGKLLTSVLPPISITDTYVVTNQTAMLALTAETGDVAVRTDLNRSFILRGTDPTMLGDWQELLTPTDLVTSVNGQQGTVVITTITGNAGTATTLQTARILTIGSSGKSFNGSSDVTWTLNEIGAQALNGNLTAISSLNTNGLARRIGVDSWVIDTNTYLTGNQTITLSGDATGSGTTAIAVTLANSGVTAGTYNNSATQVRPFTVDAKGRITSIGTAVTITPSFANVTGKPTTLAGYGITDAQPLNGNLTAISSLSTNGLARRTGVNTWVIDTNNYLTGNQTITLSGDATGSGNTSITVTLENTGVTAGTYRSVTVDSKGRVTAGTNPTTLAGYGITDAQPLDADLTAIAAFTGTGLARRTGVDTWALDTNTYLTGNQTITLSGDATGSGTTSIPVTLANSGVVAGTYNSSPTQVRPFTVDAKGRITSVGALVTITPSFADVTNKPTTLAGYGITDAQPLNSTLTSISNLAANGLIARTAAGVVAPRTITGTTNEIDVTNGNGVSGNPTLRLSNNPVLPGTGSTLLPSGTTAQRPVSPSVGMVRYNTTLGLYEAYYPTLTWEPFRVGLALNNGMPAYIEPIGSVLSSIETCNFGFSIKNRIRNAFLFTHIDVGSNEIGYYMPRNAILKTVVFNFFPKGTGNYRFVIRNGATEITSFTINVPVANVRTYFTQDVSVLLDQGMEIALFIDSSSDIEKTLSSLYISWRN